MHEYKSNETGFLNPFSDVSCKQDCVIHPMFYYKFQVKKYKEM